MGNTQRSITRIETEGLNAIVTDNEIKNNVKIL